MHREGEGASYTGLKPAGLDWGPVVPKADKAIEKGDAKETIGFLLHTVKHELQERFGKAIAKKKYDENNVTAAREYIQAMLGFVLYSHHLYTFVKGNEEHGEEAVSGHKD